jgi:hypothetical protein
MVNNSSNINKTDNHPQKESLNSDGQQVLLILVELLPITA